MVLIDYLVVTGIVLVILLVYRQLDRNNRSLEKVKRLGDKLMADLDAITQEKVVLLKDMAIDVEVHQQAGKMAIERLAVAEENLANKSSGMEDLSTRIESYDTALRELVTMTQKAEENIGRLRDESVYIDKVGRKIRQAAGQLQELQDRVPNLLQEFQDKNQLGLQAMGENIVEGLKQRLGGLESGLDTLDKDAADRYHKMNLLIQDVESNLSARAQGYRKNFDEVEHEFGQRLVATEAQYYQRLDTVAAKGAVMETEALRTLSASIQEGLDERYVQLRSIIDELGLKISAEEQAVEGEIVRLKDKTEAWERELQTTLQVAGQSLSDSLKKKDQEAAGELAGLSHFIKEAQDEIMLDLHQAQDQAKSRMEELQLMVRDLAGEARQLTEKELETFKGEVGQWQNQVLDYNSSLEEELRSHSREQDDRYEVQMRDLKNDADRHQTELENSLRSAVLLQEGLIKDFQGGAQSQLDRLEGHIYDAEKAIEEKLLEAQQRGSVLAETLLSRISNDVDTKTESMQEAINQRVDNVNASVKASHDQIDQSFNDMRGRVDGWIEASRDYMSSLESQVQTLNESSRKANLEHRETIEGYIVETRERLDAYEQHLSGRVRDLEGFITKAEDVVQDEFSRLRDHAAQLARTTTTDLDETYQRGRDEILTRSSAGFTQIREELGKGEDQLRIEYQRIVASIHDWEERANGRMNEVETLSISRADQAKFGFDQKIKGLEDLLDVRTGELKKEVSGLLEVQEKETQGLLAQSSEELRKLANQHDVINTQVEAQVRRTEELKTGSLAAFTNLRKDFEDGAIELKNMLDRSLVSTKNNIENDLKAAAQEFVKRKDSQTKELTDTAKVFSDELSFWKSGLERQIGELRGLAQGLHQDTLGEVQEQVVQVQKRANDLYDKIQNEVQVVLKDQESKVQGLLDSNENDLKRLIALGVETQGRIASWQDLVAKTERDIAGELEKVREMARAQTSNGFDDVLVELEKRKLQVTQELDESVIRLKSDISHSRSDVDQDVKFLNQQIEQWKTTFGEHLKNLQEQSKTIEEQAFEGLKERVAKLRDEAKALTRSVQDEFILATKDAQVQAGKQVEAYQTELKKVAGIRSEIEAQISDVSTELVKQRGKIKSDLDSQSAEALRLVNVFKEGFLKDTDEKHKAIFAQARQVWEHMGTELGTNKTSFDRELDLLQKQLEQQRGEVLERIKGLQADGASLRRDAMTGFQERVDALRDEARKMTGQVKTEVNQLLGEYQGEISKQLKESEDEYHRAQDMHATAQLRFQEIQEIFNRAELMAQNEFETLRDKTRTMADTTREGVQQELSRHRDDVMQQLRQNIENFAGDVGQARKDMQNQLGGLQSQFEHFSGDIKDRFAHVAAEGLRLQEEAIGVFRTDIEKIKAQSESITSTMNEQVLKSLEQQRHSITAIVAQGSDDISRGKQMNSETQELMSQLEQSVSQKVRELEEQIKRYASDTSSRIRQVSEEYQQGILGGVETRLKDYEKEISYRMEKIETVNDDIGNLEGNLRQSMERLTQKLKIDVDELGKGFRAKHDLDIQQAHKHLEAIGLKMIDVERDVDELKKRAYDNVTDGLKGFEDNFFADLKARSQRMENAIADWKGHVQGTLESISSKEQAERQMLEESYNNLIRTRLGELDAHIKGRLQKVGDEFDAFQESLRERLGSTEQELLNVQASVRDEVKGIQVSTIDAVQREFVRMNQDLENRIRTYEREVEARLQRNDQDYKNQSGDLTAMFETIRSDVTQWQSQVFNHMKASQGGLESELLTLKSYASTQLETIRTDFDKERNDLVAEGTAERANLKREVSDMAEKLANFHTDLEYKTRQVLDSLTRDYSSFQIDIQQQNRDLKEETETQILSFKQFASETRNEFETLQRRLFGKLDDDVKTVDVNLREIDKRVKSFVAQTKLFERADSLKDALADQIEKLRLDIQSVEEQRKTILDLDPYLTKVRKLAEEANEKIAKLTAEKRRLDSLDDDYKKLMSISNVVDQKMAQVTASNDTLTEIQLSMRHLEDVQKDVSAKYERLERKGDVLDATAEGIEKSFQQLRAIEGQIQGINGALNGLPQRVQDLGDRVANLSSHKKEADTALKSMVNLDKVLKDVEGRIEELNKSREWLARTETRLVEISQEADEKVNILSTLVKQDLANDSAKQSILAGGPSQSVRDVVIKLSQQGWRIEEIARTTKLSRGEVELILEMGGTRT